jgi:hypothetical protein
MSEAAGCVLRVPSGHLRVGRYGFSQYARYNYCSTILKVEKGTRRYPQYPQRNKLNKE